MGAMTVEVNGLRVIAGSAARWGAPRPAGRTRASGAAETPAPEHRGSALGGREGALEPVTPDAMVHVLSRLQPGADAGRRGDGAGPVNRLLTGVVEATVEAGSTVDPEFVAVLVTELARRYLRAVSCYARGARVPRAWREVLGRWDPENIDPARITLAGGLTIVGHDLPSAVVSTCTLLGRTPGPAERAAVQMIVGLIADRLRDDAAVVALLGSDGVGVLLSRHDAWRQAEHLWAVRGRPSEAEEERAAMDWRAGLVARGLLATHSR
ncbi:DUF5995 family protein [Pseudonocardia alaniniphila]|uniref:DUF5995 family protein n=1 Tax=Pseudonocardia alaniniphila TaxID=75291 RepID=A0ABS9TLN4_9PSEU|nr:DUF5995 family protein [Pseudonocardia alaniniphila]MCH6169444.1 DUF5995 family protein [Pseudonocardia alaniniphila]